MILKQCSVLFGFFLGFFFYHVFIPYKQEYIYMSFMEITYQKILRTLEKDLQYISGFHKEMLHVRCICFYQEKKLKEKNQTLY